MDHKLTSAYLDTTNKWFLTIVRYSPKKREDFKETQAIILVYSWKGTLYIKAYLYVQYMYAVQSFVNM